MTIETISKKDIIHWLEKRLGNLLEESPEKIDLNLPLEDFGLDSIHFVRMAGDLEKWLSIELEPALMYEYETTLAFADACAVMHQSQMKRQSQKGEALSVCIAATFTSEPIQEPLKYLLESLGYAPNFSFAPYNQIFQELLNPTSLLNSNREGFNVIFFRLEDCFRFNKDENIVEKVEKTVEEFLSSLSQYSQTNKTSTLLVLSPHSSAAVRSLGISDRLEAWDRKILDRAAANKSLKVLNFKDLEKSYKIRKIFDDARDKIGHIPYTPEFFAAMGMEVGRQIRALKQNPYKVVVLDCDNTLWQGIVGEDGVRGVRPYLDVQRFMSRQQQMGKLLCLCSKNNEEDVWQVFDRNEEMILDRQQVVAAKINWQRKSQNIAELASELNLGLDSFIFIDDNPAECEEVRTSLPDVMVICIPDGTHDRGAYLKHHYAFDRPMVTAEDRQRTQMYQTEQKRRALQAKIQDYSQFIANLEVVIEVDDLAEDEIVRAAQLTHRTNQFNATTLRCSEADIERFIQRSDVDVQSIKVRDRFGDYGFVGLLVAEESGSALICRIFLMSCRVLGKQVEQTMVRKLGELALKRGLESVQMPFRRTERNAPARDFYRSLTVQHLEEDGEDFVLHLKTGLVESATAGSKVEHQLDRPKVNNASDRQPSQKLANAERASRLDRIARWRGQVDLMLQEVRRSATLHRGDLSTAFIAPRTAWQKKIASIWCEVLGIDRVGIYDSFFELGGDSLRAAEAFARMWELGVPDSISLVNIPEPTVAMLCSAIEDVKAGRQPTLITDKFSLEDEGPVAEDICNPGYDPTTYDRPMKRVFLTGGTGYIGGFILAELYEQTEVSVNCLVRASTLEEGRAKIVKNLSRYGIWKEEYHARLSVTLGELTEPLLGLGETAFKALAADTDTIFHSGAWVNFVYPYQKLKPSHIDAMETMMRLSTAAAPKPIAFHFISTLGVIMSTGYGNDEVVMEDERLQHVEGLLNGYEQAKHVADKMAWIGMKERGIPMAIYRPGMVGGISTTGYYHKVDEFLASFYKGCVQMGAWPLLNTTWEVIPVDFLCKAIVHGAKDPQNLNHAYFSLHPEPTSVSDYIQWFQNFGYNIRALPWEVWKKELIGMGTEKLRQNALFPFVDFIRSLYEEQVRFPKTDRSNFDRLVKAAGLNVPSQTEILERYMRYFIRVGHIDAPPQNSELGNLARNRDLDAA